MAESPGIRNNFLALNLPNFDPGGLRIDEARFELRSVLDQTNLVVVTGNETTYVVGTVTGELIRQAKDWTGRINGVLAGE